MVEKRDRIKYIIKSISATILIVLAIVSAFCIFQGAGEVSAANHPVFVRIWLNGEWKMDLTDSISTLNSYIKKNKDKTIRIEMVTDWNAAETGRRDDFNKTLVIPSGANVTLDMHGHVFNRDNAWSDNSSSSGEVIQVEDGASLVINGSSNAYEDVVQHSSVPVYTSTSKGSKATGRITTYGGTLMGGVCTYGSGGLYIKSGCKVTLNNVTLAGCCSRSKILTNNGYGGGVCIYGEDSKLILNDSLITGCMADDYGGGICVYDKTITSIELNNSNIDKNYATNKGGGICLTAEKSHINGTGESYIRNNECGGDGGGIYLDMQNESVSGVIVSGNKATNGAGVYMIGGAGWVIDSAQVLTDVKVKDNTASERGGGIYVHANVLTLSTCEITNNVAKVSGGGVYINESVKNAFNIKGATIIKNNDGIYMGDNLYVSDNNPENTRIMFNLTKGADVGMSYYNLGSRERVMITEGSTGDTIKSPNCIQYLHAENRGFHISFNANPNSRKIYYVKDGHDSGESGEPVDPPVEPTAINPQNAINMGDEVEDHSNKAGIVGTVGAGGYAGASYNLIRGFTRHQETDSDNNDAAVAFYYTDGFFDNTCDPAQYNEHLATASINMAYAGMYLRAKESEDSSGNYYYNKHGGARQFMADIGCPDQNIYVNDSNEHKPGTDSIGVTIASKELANRFGDKTGKILIPIVTRGGGYELEWASNGTLKKANEMQQDGKILEAAGFSNAADQVMESIENYIDKYNLQDEIDAGNVKFWIAGYSRGGATANITAKRLIEKYADGTSGKNNQVFAYTCEAPMGGADVAEKLSDKTKYYCIHNMINAVDVVPLVAPKEMCFKRYGVDHFIPGSAAGGIDVKNTTEKRTGSTSTPRTVYRDNAEALIKQLDEARKDSMLKQMKYVESGIILDDYFHPAYLSFVPPKPYEVGNYNDNHVEFMANDFLRFVMEGTKPNELSHWTQIIPERTYYANNLQPTIRDILAIVFAMPPESMAGFSGRAGTTLDRIPYISGDISLRELATKIFYTGWHTLSDKDKKSVETILFTKFKETGALEYLSKDDANKFEKHWNKLINMAFTLAEADNEYKPGPISAWAGGSEKTMMLLVSFANSANYILQNHYPEVNLAWARSYDSYYYGETKEYRVKYQQEAKNAGYRVNIPKAYGTKKVSSTVLGVGVTEEQPVELQEGSLKSNKLSGDQKIVLENEDIVGEAVYYDLKDNDTGKLLASNLLYRGGVDLSLGTESSKNFTITTYDMSYGVKSNNAVYNIKLINDKHKVTVKADGIHGIEYYYQEDDNVTITAIEADDEYFDSWTIELQNAAGRTIESDIAMFLLRDEHGMSHTRDSIATFVLPKTGDSYGDRKYPEGYSLVIKATFDDRIKNVTVDLPAPDASSTEGLFDEANVSFDNGALDSVYNVAWTYTYNGKTHAATDTVYKNVDYTATITMSKDKANKVMFSPDSMLSAIYDGDQDKINSISIEKNEQDGSATIVINYKTTEEGELPPDADIELDVNAWDLNINNYVRDEHGDVYKAEYHTIQGNVVSLTALDVPDESFNSWEFLDTGITLASGYSYTDKTVKVIIPDGISVSTLEIRAQYVPVINRIDIKLSEPVGGQPIQTAAIDTPGNETMKVTISNEYIVSPQCIQIAWVPDPLIDGEKRIADYNVNYNATIILNKVNVSGEDCILVKRVGDTDYFPISANFLYAEKPVVTVNGSSADIDKDFNSVNYTFPLTKYIFKEIEQPDDIDVIHGTTDAEIIDLMPSTATIITQEGNRFISELDPTKWEIDRRVDPPDPREEKEYVVYQNVDIPEYIKTNPSDVTTIAIRVYIEEADVAYSPEATLKSGTFLYDQQTELTTEETGGEIYYTLGESDYYTKYDGNPIDIKRDNPAVVDEKTTDEHGQEIITGRKILYLSAYTRKSGMWDSAIVTYEYIFTDEVPVPEGEILDYNGSEQIGVWSGDFYTIERVSEGGHVNDDGDAVATDIGMYDATLKVKDGYKWSLPNEETSYDDQTVPFEIRQREIKTAKITYDLNGGTLDGSTENIVLDCEIGRETDILKAPTRDGYTFAYWKGSKYMPGDKYTVAEDHTFTAQWDKNPDPGPGGGQGDNPNNDSGDNSDTDIISIWTNGTLTKDDAMMLLAFTLVVAGLATIITVVLHKRRRR